MPVHPDLVPSWLKPENASVMDDTWTTVARAIAHLMGADTSAGLVGQMMPMAMDVPNPPGTEAGGIAGLVQKYIKAYHGSPHDFEQFDASKIGTGEGAQAYGHGLYFAEHPETAKAYRDALSNFGQSSAMPDDMAKSILLDNKIVSGSEPSNRLSALQRAALAKHYAGGIQARAIQETEDSLKYMTPGTEAYKMDAETLHVLKTVDLTGRVQPFKGRMYEVAIKADPEHFLDWDKPLSQQSEKVQQAIRKLAGDNPEVQDALGHANGQEILRQLLPITRDFGSREPDILSQEIKRAGIPGIKYLDQGSRTAGEGSRNYVVFDEKTIEILKKYGLIPPMAGATLQQGGANGEQGRH